MKMPTQEKKMTTANGHQITVTAHRTPLGATRSMSAAQRKLHNATVWALPGGGFDIFPSGHPVPAGAERLLRTSGSRYDRGATTGDHYLAR